MKTKATSNRHCRSVVLAAAGLAVALSCALLTGGCDAKPGAVKSDSHADAAAPTNRVDVPAAVRQNLGITFAKVERRNVAKMLRVPGRFELPPDARREYRAAAEGIVEVLVKQYQAVRAGDALYRLDSPRWREMQKELADAEAAVRLARAAADSIAPLMEAHERHHAELQKAVDLWAARVATIEKLQAAGGARGDEVAQATASLASARSALAETFEKEAELAAKKTETAAHHESASARLAFLFEAAATLAGVPAAELRAPSAGDGSPPRWRAISTIEVRALASGVVESVDSVSGGVTDRQAAVLTVVQPSRVRFRAVALQSDLSRLAEGMRASVAAAQGVLANAEGPSFAGALTVAPTADAERRTVDLILSADAAAPVPAWARPGVSAYLEVVTAGGVEELAIPLRCVGRDGSAVVIFRRDPANPDKVIRLEADLGIDDGRWIVIKSGVAEGNEIVLDGVYQLMAATSGGMTKGGHFHPDGTFHEGGH